MFNLTGHMMHWKIYSMKNLLQRNGKKGRGLGLPQKIN